MIMDYTNKIMTVTDGKRNFLKIVDEMTQLKDVVVFSKNGLPATVMLAIDDFEAMKETMEILGNPSIMRVLRKAKKDGKSRKLYTDKDVWD